MNRADSISDDRCDEFSLTFELRLQRARAGDRDAIGALLKHYVDYLRVLAQSQLDGRLRRRLNPSDIVQETMLAAHRDFTSFRGESKPELLCWLRAILIHVLHRNFDRHIKARKRDIRREVPIEESSPSVQGSGELLRATLPARSDSPSTPLRRRERESELLARIAQLSPDHARVISLRIVNGLSFDEIAIEMGRSCGAVRMLWLRALESFKKLQEEASGRLQSN